MKLTRTEFAYYVLDSIDGINTDAKRTVASLFDDVAMLISDFSSFEDDIKAIIKGKPFDSLKALVSNRDKLKSKYEEFLKFNCAFTAIGLENYPKKLEELSNPPFAIYYRGNLRLIDTELILFAGTRTCTRYGVDVTKSFSKSFIENELTVLSGISDGIDTAAVESVLENGGKAVVVCAGGIDNVAPAINFDLKSDVEKSGLVLSEFAPNTSPQRFHYLLRNRILAALCDVAILVEADENSKSLGVINYASDMGKEIFAIPGNLTSKTSVAPNTLIANETARALVEPKQVVEIFRDECYFTPKKIKVISPSENKIIEVFDKKTLHIDEICDKLNTNTSGIITDLIILESKKVLRRLAGNYYELISEEGIL